MKQEWVDGSLVRKVHEILTAVITPGDTVVDATLGNGYDTLFLAQCVGEKGKVIGFDIQQEAVRSTRARLESAGLLMDRIELHQVGHEKMQHYAPEGIAAVVFNLGYLPGSDKSVITLPETTLKAMRSAISLLKSGGLLSIMCYPRHNGGEDEAARVVDWVCGLNDCARSIRRFDRMHSKEHSPFLCIVEKH